MKKYLPIFMSALLAQGCFALDLKTQISLDESRKEGVWIKLTIINETNELRSCINGTLIGLSGEISHPVLKVKRDKLDVPYSGVFVSRTAQTTPNISILPMSSVTTEIDISQMYDFTKSGIYDIQYDYESASFCSRGYSYKLISNTVRFAKP